MKKNIADILYLVFLVTAVVLFIYKIYLTKRGITNDIELIDSLMYGFLLASFIVRISMRYFPGWYKNKPSREEMDRKEQGN